MNELEIQASMREAIAWLTYRMQHPPKQVKPSIRSFWSWIFGPSIAYSDRFWSRAFNMQPPAMFSLHDEPIAQRLDELIEKRRNYLRHQNIPFPTPGSEESKGRLLVCRYRETTFDSAPEAVTGGLFDPGDIPSWDTWVTVHEGPKGPELITWIPQAWLFEVECAIEAAPLSNILWLNESDANYQTIVSALRQLTAP